MRAANRIRRRSPIVAIVASQLSPKALKKKMKKQEKERAEKKSKEELQQEAINYIMAMIKRDSKPTNPETVILIKLFERFNEEKSKELYFDDIQAFLKSRL